MMSKLWEGLSGKLAERWLELLFSPALIFWVLGGWLVLPAEYWAALDKSINTGPTLRQIIMVAAALLLVAFSAAMARHLRFPTLRLLEGYWPPALALLRRLFVYFADRQWAKQDASFQKLAVKGLDKLNADELAEYQRLDEAMMLSPVDKRYLMPTRLGRILRAAELAPNERYCLDGVICWPRLWLLLPENARAELTQARAELDAAAELWLWGLLFLAWFHWAIWIPVLALSLMLYAYRRALRAAEVYAALIVAAYDLHRVDLYQALRWPLPKNPAEERTQGVALTAYLWRGSDRDQPVFVEKKAGKEVE